MKKKTEDEMVACINKAITELVYPKYKLQKAYNYYNGVRDAEQFRALEENFGLDVFNDEDVICNAIRHYVEEHVEE